MAHVLAFGRFVPEIDDDVFMAPTATVIGRVRIEKGASIWFGAVLRGDLGPISIGAGAVVEDNCVLHADSVLEERALLGHAAVVEAATIRAGGLVGNGSLLFEGADVGEGSMVAAGSVVRGLKVPPGVLVAGRPATVRKELTGPAAWWVATAAATYGRLAHAHQHGFTDEELEELSGGPWRGRPADPQNG